MATADVRPLTRDDLDWVLDLIEPRRQQLREHAPRFWNPAPNARELHGRFLGSQVDGAEVVTLRTDNGFVFAGPRGDGYIIDDLLVASDELWPTEGADLVRAAAAGRRVRIVCPCHEDGRAGMAGSLELGVAESWWTRDLAPVAGAASDAGQAGEVTIDGTSGRLLEPPPVYAPGGPVLIVDTVSTPAALAAVEQRAAAAGSPVAVVAQQAADRSRAELLRQAGYRRTTDYYDGVLGA